MFDEEGFVASLLLRDDEVGYDWRWVEVEVVVCDGSVERLENCEGWRQLTEDLESKIYGEVVAGGHDCE